MKIVTTFEQSFIKPNQHWKKRDPEKGEAVSKHIWSRYQSETELTFMYVARSQ